MDNFLIETPSEKAVSVSLSIDHWAYLYGRPANSGKIKVEPSDFVVIENLGFEPSGEGEHCFLWVKKTNLNTAFVAEALAKFANVALRDLTYAGRKDKYAETYQWFSAHIPNKKSPDWSKFELAGASIIHTKWHNKKLRTGVLRGNNFLIKIKSLSLVDKVDLIARLEKIKRDGVPNYYGDQRFGEIRLANNNANKKGGNLALAERMMQGEKIKNRNKRSVVISALRSWLFNECVHQRISHKLFSQPVVGDAMQLTGSNSFFVYQSQTENSAENQKQNITARLADNDIAITAPLVGKGKLHTYAEALTTEEKWLSKHQTIVDTLAGLGLKQERRAIKLYVDNFSWQLQDDTLTLSFTLPSGCFATSVVREVINLYEEEK